MTRLSLVATTADMDALQREAITVGLKSLHETLKPADALYAVYDHFRVKFLEERGKSATDQKFASYDARELEAYVSACWAQAILDTPWSVDAA